MIFLPFIYGVLSSWHGGQITIPHDVKVVKNIAWCVPALIVSLIYLPLWCAVFIPLCALKGTGHGRVWNPRLPLDLTKDPEKAESAIKWLVGKIPDFWYKTIAMSLIGAMAASGAVLAFLCAGHYLGAAYILLGGIAKGLNAIIFTGYKENKDVYNSTEAREVADGVAFGTGILAALWTL